jgi:hypothetical protein
LNILIGSLSEAGPNPPPVDRYRQDQALADFFGNAFSAFESTFFALYSIGVFISPIHFSLATPKDQQRVAPAQTLAAFRTAFPTDPIVQDLETLLGEPTFKEMREIRNVVVHRSMPGRRMYVGLVQDDAPPTEWKMRNIKLNEEMTKNLLYNFQRNFSTLIEGIETFLSIKRQQE